MQKRKVNQITDELCKYTYSGNKSDYITITKWANGDGYDIDINGKILMLSMDELDAINYLALVMRYETNN